ncbi:hypothetical protein GGI20_005075 [Coemansia sp. BCRC 34301]|nr:hypothetical protein GGI20_005075 [Coemansia sp. BCRC 34301]
MTTEVDEAGSGGLQAAKRKTQLEDMLEAYYLSHGRPVPDWVHCPPPDPPANVEEVSREASSVVVGKMPAYKSASSLASLREGDSEAERCSKAKSKNSSSTSGALKSFTRLNISRLARAQFSLGGGGVNSSPASTGGPALDIAGDQVLYTAADPGQALRGREVPVAEQARDAHDSGFNSPMLSPREGATGHYVPAIDVRIVDSGNTTPESMRPLNSVATPGISSSMQTPLGSDLAMAKQANGSASPCAKSPNLIKRSLTLDRWRHRDVGSKKNRMGSPISLASLMPGNNDGQASEAKPTPPSLSFDTPDLLGLRRPQLMPSKSEPFKPEPSRAARPKFSVRLRHRPEPSKRENETMPTLADAGTRGDASAKHTIPGAGKVKRLFRRRSSHDQK